MDPFVWNDETVVNSFGFMVKNAGGRFARFDSNPVMLLQHKQDDVIGRWKDRRIEGTQLLATPEYDEADDKALKIKGKVERGFMKGCSMGIEPLEWEITTMPDGSVVPVVTKWDWYETSLCSVPSNGSAVRLYEKGRELSVKEIKNKVVELTMSNQNNPVMEFKLTIDAYKALQLGENAGTPEISAAIIALKAKADEALNSIAAQKKTAAEELVQTALSKGQITADKKESFVALAISDYNQAKTILSAIPEKKEVGPKVKEGNHTELAGRDDWDITRWRKEDPAGLQLMKKQEPERYNALTSSLDAKLKNAGSIE